MEEALKCPALSAVVGEIRDLDFTASRRLQLAVERSCVTGFVIRKNLSTINTTACVSRWRITSLPGATDDDMPGVGFPVWKIELLRMRNGQPGCWVVRWMNEEFVEEQLHVAATAGPERKAI
jgi:protein ImuA